MDTFVRVLVLVGGAALIVFTLFSAISTIVLPRAARSFVTKVVFESLGTIFGFVLRFIKSYRRRDAVMAYYAPIGLLLLVPAWYILISLGFTGIYWSLGVRNWETAFRLSGSSLFTLGFANAEGLLIATLEFTEAMLGLILVGLLISYLPTMYSAFSRREQVVNMLDVRAGSPPTPLTMITRFHGIQGLERLADYWPVWEAWFADIEESHTTLPAMVFFRSPRLQDSWVTAAGAVLDAASITLSSVDVPNAPSAALCIRAGFLCLRRVANYFDLPNPQDPHFPDEPISVSRAEFDAVLDALAADGVPLKADRDQAWKDFAGWRVNYDRALVLLCGLVMAPQAKWSSDRLPANSFLDSTASPVDN